MRREDLMKPDQLSSALLLSSGLVLVAAWSWLWYLRLDMPHRLRLPLAGGRFTAPRQSRSVQQSSVSWKTCSCRHDSQSFFTNPVGGGNAIWTFSYHCSVVADSLGRRLSDVPCS